MYSKILALAGLGVALSGCATIIKGTTQSVFVTTSPATGAQCVLKNGKGEWHVTSPGAVTVHKADDNLLVSCVKPGFADASRIVPRHLDGMTFVGGPAGVGVDAASGSLFSYPKTIDVPMTALGPS